MLASNPHDLLPPTPPSPPLAPSNYDMPSDTDADAWCWAPPAPPTDIEAKYRASSRFRNALFHSLQTDSPAARAAALASTAQIVHSWADLCFADAARPSTAPPRSGSGGDPGAMADGSDLAAPPSPVSLAPTPEDSTASLPGGTTAHLLGRQPSLPALRGNSAPDPATASLSLSRSNSVGSAHGSVRRSNSTSGPSGAASSARALHKSPSLTLPRTPPASNGSGASTPSSSSSSSPSSSMSITGNNDDAVPSSPLDAHEETRHLLHLHLLTLVRLAATCPHADVRSGLRAVLRDVRVRHGIPLPRPVHPSPSCFIAATALAPLPAATDHEAVRLPRIGYGTPRDVRNALDDVFLSASAGRVDHLDRVLAYFPRYLRKSRRAAHHLVFDMPGPLPRTWRLFLGLTAAAQHRNLAVAGLFRLEFLQQAGDPAWIDPATGGVHAGTAVPAKLAALAPLNALLAHQPWRVGAQHIARLVVDHGWSVGELVHAIVVLATVHAQSAMAFGCGVVPELDAPGGAVYVAPPPADAAETSAVPAAVEDEVALVASPPAELVAEAAEGGVAGGIVSPAELSLTDQLISRLMESSAMLDSEGEADEPAAAAAPEAAQEGQQRALFEKCENPDISASDSESERDLVPPHLDHSYLARVPPSTDPATAPILAPGCVPALSAADLDRMADVYTASPDDCEGVSGYVDFDVKSTQYSVFRLTDWSWEDHGVELVSKYLGHELAEYLDDAFEEARHMTIYSVFSTGEEDDEEEDYDDYDESEDDDQDGDASPATGAGAGGDTHSIAGSTSTWGASGVDTAPFREAIWYYSLRLFGQSMDDYQYALVNHFVNKRTKAFIKKVATAPHALAFRDWMRMGIVLRPEEKAHVVVLVAEARKQAELVWALSAVVKYLDGGRSR
ncbi:hypothetical protein H9P43_008307 [Blastocladiella emersonii ATCC 22665]|nr:hypothetical protein H9P43_008307 [Blastocladiella emersonii ATCC 22665]